jgi:hypothetical protein
MSRPEKIRICPDEVHFQHVGRLRHPDGLFMASVTGTFSIKAPDRPRRCLAVLHLFHPDGTHLQTVVYPKGCEPGSEAEVEAAHEAFDDILSLLLERDPVIEDIWVKPFEAGIDGMVHGLIYECQDDPDGPIECVWLEPRDIMFHPPWDSGEYST